MVRGRARCGGVDCQHFRPLVAQGNSNSQIAALSLCCESDLENRNASISPRRGSRCALSRAVRFVQLSILLATHRHDLTACSRIAQACSWASPKIEVIVRDNSGDAKKRELLALFQRDNCKIICVDPCEGLENFSEALRLATGDFVFFLADDDLYFDRAIAALPGLIDQIVGDPSVAGVTGAYAIEMAAGSAIADYKDLESGDPAMRLAGYLGNTGPNVLVYSPVRRELVQRVAAFMTSMPFHFSFRDQIICLLYLLNGKFVRLERVLYAYDIGDWEAAESAQKRDLSSYKDGGLDPVINMLHWFLCGFEGAMVIRNGDVFPDYSLGMRQAMADCWFSVMFIRFKGNPRLTFDSPFVGEAEKLCAKLQKSAGQLTFDNMLADISGFFALFSKQQGQRYFDFWNAVLNKRKPVTRPMAAAGGR